MKSTPAAMGVLIVITAIVTFIVGVLLSHGDVSLAVTILISLAAIWLLAAARST